MGAPSTRPRPGARCITRVPHPYRQRLGLYGWLDRISFVGLVVALAAWFAATAAAVVL